MCKDSHSTAGRSCGWGSREHVGNLWEMQNVIINRILIISYQLNFSLVHDKCSACGIKFVNLILAHGSFLARGAALSLTLVILRMMTSHDREGPPARQQEILHPMYGWSHSHHIQIVNEFLWPINGRSLAEYVLTVSILYCKCNCTNSKFGQKMLNFQNVLSFIQYYIDHNSEKVFKV